VSSGWELIGRKTNPEFPFQENEGAGWPDNWFLPGTIPRKVVFMSAAAEIPWTPQDSNAELHPLLVNAPLGLAQCQRAGNITALSPALELMLGGRSRIAGSLNFADLVDPQDRTKAERLLGELFERRRDSFQMDSESRAGTFRPMHWTAWRVAGANNGPDYALVLAEDATRSQQAEQRLRQAEGLEVVGRLAGGVAHDFNNLLTGVLLYCDLLMAHLEPCHRVRKYAEEIRNAGMQATGLVRQLLAVARPTTCEPQLLLLNDIAEGMRNLLVRLIGENIELKFNLDPDLGFIKMDSTQCQQILLNLVLNARDAVSGATSETTSGGGQIMIETCNCKVQVLTERRSGGAHSGEPQSGGPDSGVGSQASLPCALFVVADNGSGMDAATRAHLFEAFFTTKAGTGTGLGLATVYDIVNKNGGLIHVDSAPACGTRVSVLLPLVPPSLVRFEEMPRDFHPQRNSEELIPKELRAKE
jgi:two-component system, cell cycle sensor histidine kinase and response regulator CckA